MAKKTEKDLEKALKDLRQKIVNQRETVKELNAKRIADVKRIKELETTIEKLKEAKVEEIGKEILGVYLKYITEQYGEEQTDDETGETIGKMFAFTFQEKNENEFHMMPQQDEDGRLTMVCAVTYPEKGEDDDTGRENS